MPEILTSQLADLPQLAECHIKTFPGSLSSHQGLGFVRKMLEWYIAAERGVMFHVVAEGRIVGYSGGIKIYEPGLPGAITSISQYAFWAFVRAYLKKPWLLFQGRGLGSDMIREFERRARIDGVDRLQLSVKATNQQAIKSYERNGWRAVEPFGEAISMRKELRD